MNDGVTTWDHARCLVEFRLDLDVYDMIQVPTERPSQESEGSTVLISTALSGQGPVAANDLCTVG